MITGANTNVRYRGVVFHVQTEDSGRAHPHIISHLYHGGTILGSEKTGYADQVEADDLAGIVRGLIQQQHIEMVRKLRGGGFDAVIEERLGPGVLQPRVGEAPNTMPDVGSLGDVSDGPPEASPAAVRRRVGRAFGEGIAAQRPLDELVLDYLSERATGRSGTPGPGDEGARKPSSRG